MAHPVDHAERSAQLFGGTAADYQDIHDWFDSAKAHLADFRHRAIRHHSEGIFQCEALFGRTITNSEGRTVPVRQIGEQHVMDDLGRIPSVKDWLQCLVPQPWMTRTPWKPERARRRARKLASELNSPE